MRVCETCEVDIGHLHGNARYCSAECTIIARRKSENARYIETRTPIYCKGCGEDIFGSAGPVKWCRPCRVEYDKKRLQEYARSDAGKAAKKEYLQRPEVKEARRDYHREYYYTPNGRAAIVRGREKYTQTDCGKMMNRLRAHKRRGSEVKYLGIVSPNIMSVLLDKQDNICVYCRRSFDDVAPTLDHITPISKGGWHDNLNLQVLCGACNSSKRDQTPEEYLCGVV